MAASTVLEALTAELLGDVGVLHDQVKYLRTILPTVGQEVSEKIELQTGNMLAAATALSAVLASMAKQVDAYAQAAATKAVESSKVDIRKAAAEAAATSVSEAVGTEVRKVVSLVTDAAAELVRETASAQANIRSASKQVAWGWGRGVSVMFGASALGALFLFVALHLSGFINMKPLAGLSDADAKSLQNGRTIEKIWNRLSQQERNHIDELSKAQ